MIKACVVSLHSGCGRCVAVIHCAVDHVKAWLPLVEPQLEVGAAAPGEILRPPLDVEDAIRCRAAYRCEYPKSTVNQIEVVPVRVDCVVVGGPWQALVGEGRIGCHKLGIAVGRQIDRGEGLTVQGERERQRDGGYLVIPVITNVGGARHNASAYLNYRKTCAWYRRWGRRSRRGRRWAGCRCWGWRRQRNVTSGLNTNKAWRAGLKVAYHRVGWIGRLIGIEPEIIQRAEANRIGVLILRKRFGVPGDRACVLGNTPWRAAISLVVKGAIICPAGLLNRRMKSNVRDVYSWPNRNAERLDRAIQVLVVESIFIVPDPRAGVRHFVPHEPDAIIAVIRFDLVYRRPRPSRDRRMRSHS